MSALDLFSPDVRAAIEALIDERVAAALAARPNGSPWLTIAEAAEYAHVSTRTLARLLAAGKLRSTCLGNRRLVHRADLDALLEARRPRERNSV